MGAAKAVGALEHGLKLLSGFVDVKYFLLQSPLGIKASSTLFFMVDLGKMLLLLGAIVVVVGLLLMVSGRMHLPLGRLPGDIVYRGKNTTVYFPIVTSIVLSVILSVVMFLVGRFRH